MLIFIPAGFINPAEQGCKPNAFMLLVLKRMQKVLEHL